MTTADQEALVRQVFHEGSDQPNSGEVLETIFAPDFTCHGPPEMAHSHEDGPEGIERCIFNNAFANLRFELGEVTVEGDRVTARFAARGVQVADFMGVRPRPDEVTANGVATFRIADGRVAEAWGTLMWGE